MNAILICSIIGIAILSAPAANYWMIVTRGKAFENLKSLWVYTAFEMLFNACVLYIMYYLLMNYLITNPSFILFFIFSHGSIFTSLMLILPILYSTYWMLDAILKPIIRAICRNKVIAIIFNWINRTKIADWLNRHFSIYFADSVEIDLSFFLSSKFVKFFLVLIYIISGILTASNLANNFIMWHLKDIYEKKKVFQDVYKNDLNLYTEIFLVSFLSFVTSHSLNKRNHS